MSSEGPPAAGSSAIDASCLPGLLNLRPSYDNHKHLAQADVLFHLRGYINTLMAYDPQAFLVFLSQREEVLEAFDVDGTKS